MIGEHVLTLHETNTRAFIPLCSCGWMGLANPTPLGRRKRNGPLKPYPTAEKESAAAQHADHVQRCARPLVDRMNP